MNRVCVERDVTIGELYIYPCRGIPGIKVNEVCLGEYGVLHDRLFVIIDSKTLQPVTSSGSPEVTSLSQKIEQNNLVVSSKHLKGHVKIPMDEINSERMTECARNYRGYKCDDSISAWLSDALEREVFMIRAADDRLTALYMGKKILEVLETDRHQSFTTDAALHLVNLASVRDLSQRLTQRYPHGLDNFMLDKRNWRANIYIDTDEAYEEDRFAEMRIG